MSGKQWFAWYPVWWTETNILGDQDFVIAWLTWLPRQPHD